MPTIIGIYTGDAHNAEPEADFVGNDDEGDEGEEINDGDILDSDDDMDYENITLFWHFYVSIPPHVEISSV